MSTRILALCLSLALTPTLGAAQVAAAAPEAPVAAVTPVAPVAPIVTAVAAAPGPANAAPVALAAQAAQASTPQPAQAPQPAATPGPARDRGERSAERLQIERERASAEADRRRASEQSKGVNVRIDATVIESRGEQVTGRKMLTVTLVDGEWGSVRSSQQVPVHPKGSAPSVFSYRASPLNMDARAFLRDDGRIKVALTLEYSGLPAEQGSASDQQPEAVVPGAVDNGIKQNVTVVLESGKPLVVAQSSDAVGDRRVALELKATVLK